MGHIPIPQCWEKEEHEGPLHLFIDWLDSTWPSPWSPHPENPAATFRKCALPCASWPKPSAPFPQAHHPLGHKLARASPIPYPFPLQPCHIMPAAPETMNHSHQSRRLTQGPPNSCIWKSKPVKHSTTPRPEARPEEGASVCRMLPCTVAQDEEGRAGAELTAHMFWPGSRAPLASSSAEPAT